ncbi:hypothetical protein [Labrys neptuniae]
MPYDADETAGHASPSRILFGGFLGCLLIGLAAGSAPANAAPSIRWEVANRFPLLREEAHFRALADIYAALPLPDRQNQPVMALEVELEKRANARQLGPAFGDPATIWRYGWASALVRSTCFSATNRGHWACRLANGEDYIGARKADVLASLAEPPAGQDCQWLVNGAAVATAACKAEVRLANIPIDAAFTVTVKVGDTVLSEAPGQLIRPITIVGMGDSFAAGEGNPDKAAVMGTDVSDFHRSSHLPGESGLFGKVRLYPLRVGHAPGVFGLQALWLNQQCHRSLYSHQLKAALAIALEAPHVSVTYLGYACTGAEVNEGLLGYWKARDDVASAQYDASPQIMRALRDLCQDRRGYNRFAIPDRFDWENDLNPCGAFRSRRPDALLLSIGGNDIGFSSVIANEVIGEDSGFSLYRRLLYGLWLKTAGPIPFSEAISNQSRLSERYAALGRAFEKLLGIDASRVIQTGYPQMLQLDNGTCPLGAAGMDLHEIFSLRKTSTGPDSVEFVKELNAKIDTLVPWQVVSGFASAFAGHALCQSGMADGSDSADGLKFPTSNAQGRNWTPFAPPAWQVYRPRRRWFVTPNDGFLAANSMRTRSGSGGDIDTLGIAQPLIAATLSGSFHPNALGQAAMGDGVLKTLRHKLGLPVSTGP